MPKTTATTADTSSSRTKTVQAKGKIASAKAASKSSKASTKVLASVKSKTGAKPFKDSKLLQLLEFDSGIRQQWLQHESAVLIGTDEVGRGCLAGPVVAAAVCLGDITAQSELASALEKLDDSKKLSQAKREYLASVLKANCRYAIGEASVKEIDKLNILQASFLAMRRAMEQLALEDNAVILVDGNQKISKFALQQILVIGGDGISASIAAASVIAKVHRDNLMRDLHEKHPHYSWDTNKGYGSKEHCDAINKHGLTVWHRKKFCAKLMQEQLMLL